MPSSQRQPHPADVADSYAQAPVPGHHAVPRRRTAQKVIYTTPPDYDTDAVAVEVRHQGRRRDWVLPLILTTLTAILGYFLLTQWVLPALNHVSSQWHYGDARMGYQTITVNGVPRDVVTIGYHSNLVVLLLANPHDPHSTATEYLVPESFADTHSRAITVVVQDVNHDTIPDLVIQVSETTQESSVDPVLYGRPDGTFSWAVPTTKGA